VGRIADEASLRVSTSIPTVVHHGGFLIAARIAGVTTERVVEPVGVEAEGTVRVL
jgi:hypothetical protein